MSVEDTILKILEARAKGLDDDEVAEEAGINNFILKSYEKSVKRGISSAIAKGLTGLEAIARSVNLSPNTTYRFMSYYEISLPKERSSRKKRSYVPKGIELSEETPRPITWRLLRVERIREAISSGAADLDEIGQRVGLAPSTVRAFAYQNGIKLPSARIAKRKGKIAQIQEAIDDGATSVSDISRRLGLNRSSILYCAKVDGFSLAKKIRANRTQKKAEIKANKIRQAIADGALGAADISRRTGLSDDLVRYFAKKSGVEIVNPRAKRAVKIGIVQKALLEGVKPLEELCRRSGFKPSGFRQFCKSNNISLPSDLIPYRYNPDIDRLVDEGQSLETVADKVGLSREGVRTYLLDSGQHVLWKKTRERIENEAEELHQIRTNLVSLLTAKWVDSVRNQGWAYRMAVDYITNHPRNLVPLSKLVVLFARYETAMKEGRKLSLEELSEGLGIWYSNTSQIFKNAGLEPMYGTNVRSSPASPEQVSAMKRGLKRGMSGADVAYFLNLPYQVVQHRFARMGKSPNVSHFGWVKVDKRLSRKLTCRLASQIYEAQDAGFNKEETAELLDTLPAMVVFALSNRSDFEPKIIKKLKVLYHSDIDKPYRIS